MQIHELKRKNPLKKKKLIGRGGKRGKTSGKGTKGQLARAGRKLRPELRDIIKKIPKLRGYRVGTISPKMVPVNLTVLDKTFSSGEIVSRESLASKKIVSKVASRFPLVKILATGVITKALTIKDCSVSAAAKEKIEKAGGKVI